MDNLNKLVEKMGLGQNIEIDDIPNIDLYMDQVIQLFESKFESTKRDKDDKILTKTMINNYAKGKLFFPIKNKKYSKEHLILISLIYQLKGSLSISDIKTTLDGINEQAVSGEMDLEVFYRSYSSLYKLAVEDFKEALPKRLDEVKEEVAGSDELLEKTLLIASLVNISNLYRRAAEKLVDEL
ncbi:DUF1836 domain-containing protein [Bacillus sp. DNRA2]|uniref:DUF1836 domain-containing protein n=1 Tax=Bacillus sp. DNRA2 TaxID=2723053 RepID=UPI00145EE60E|nr:DUF1836 domain-containing protein [Bacillus sp. DNRA2]NMD69653.1 DUF1836 domain-containing protein [Bacillus sp. DNRA2]